MRRINNDFSSTVPRPNTQIVKKGSRLWTPQKVAELKEEHTRSTLEALAHRLGKSPIAVFGKMYERAQSSEGWDLVSINIHRQELKSLYPSMFKESAQRRTQRSQEFRERVKRNNQLHQDFLDKNSQYSQEEVQEVITQINGRNVTAAKLLFTYRHKKTTPLELGRIIAKKTPSLIDSHALENAIDQALNYKLATLIEQRFTPLLDEPFEELKEEERLLFYDTNPTINLLIYQGRNIKEVSQAVNKSSSNVHTYLESRLLHRAYKAAQAIESLHLSQDNKKLALLIGLEEMLFQAEISTIQKNSTEAQNYQELIRKGLDQEEIAQEIGTHKAKVCKDLRKHNLREWYHTAQALYKLHNL